ncbi:DUF1289 domain-containing protein [Novosphingobium sp.]|uniref:DUF1289 domain-containing protein n=1 Tax=Novosphingobium sp. TaxID=1874826 RepID=UPI00263615C6|nr:DUF1289 domain-containing protein [Novosphingobium sp.]
MTLSDPPSPCAKVCAIDSASKLCRGCHRTLDEITEWGFAGPARKHAILAAVAARQRASVRSI